VQSFVFLGLLVFELEPMYATSDRQTDGRTTDADDRLMPPPPLRGRGHNNIARVHPVIDECKTAPSGRRPKTKPDDLSQTTNQPNRQLTVT